MPKIRMDTEERLATPASRYEYSAARLDHLAAVGGSEMTLVTIYSDTSSSVSPFKDEMSKCLRQAVVDLQEWGKKSGRANSVLLRWVTFASDVIEQHGFRLLGECDPSDYALKVGGQTHCYEAVTKGLEATGDYAGTLAASDWSVNALSIAITDGQEYPGDRAFPVGGVGAALKDLKQRHEEIESHTGILVGVNTRGNDAIKQYLATFESEAGWDHMRTIEDADTDGLLDLGNLIVSSVSATSVAVGTGGASTSLGL